MEKNYYKVIFISILFLGITIKAISQNELYYAIGISNNKTDILTKASSYPKLNNFIDATWEISSNDILEIKKEYDEYLKSRDPNDEYVGRLVENSSLNSIISESELIFALTDVIIERAKQELATAYFDRLTNKMETETITLKLANNCTSQIYIKDVSPNFYLLVKNSKANMNLEIGNTFVSALRKDIENLPNAIDEKVIPECYKKTIEYTIFNTVYKLYDNINNGNSLPYSISSLRPSSLTNEADYILNILVGISESMLDKSNTNWIVANETEISSSIELYLGLLYNNSKLRDSFNKLGFSAEKKEKFIIEISNSIQKLYSISKKIKEHNALESSNQLSYRNDYLDDNNSKANLHNTLNLSVNIAGDLIYVINSFSTYIKNDLNKKSIEKGIYISEQLLALYSSIKQNQYSDAVLTSLSLINQVANETEIPASFVQYLTLAADISQAQSVEEAKNILNNAILPVGSYKIKRSVSFSSSINAYIGLNGGGEFLDFKMLENQHAGYIGPFLPIGIDLSWSKGTESKMSFSHSAFISIIDLGVVAGYRFDNDSTLSVDKVPEIKFKHIISPGLFYVCGIKNSPISFGGGVQFSPLLRSISDENSIVLNNASSLRYSLFVAVDIPLMNLSVKGRKK